MGMIQEMQLYKYVHFYSAIMYNYSIKYCII